MANRNAFYTHQPVLQHVLNTINTGDVLEFGVGEGSTHIMHKVCYEQNRRLVSIEGSKEWLGKYLAYETLNHTLAHFTVDGILTKEYQFFKEKFSIVFVDAAPAEIRMAFILLMKNNVDYFIVHDTEPIATAYGWNFSMFKHVLHYKKETPWTTILSNLDTIDANLLKIF